MNLKITKIVILLVVALALLAWLRESGVYDFDIRTIIPFCRGEAGLYDVGGLILCCLGLWGWVRLRCGASGAGDEYEMEEEEYETYQPEEQEEEEESGEDRA